MSRDRDRTDDSRIESRSALSIESLELSRREALSLSTAAGLGLVAGVPLILGSENIAEAAKRAPQVPTRTLGRTGKKIPILLVGGSIRLDMRFDPKLAECFRYGVNYFDVADCYAGGTSETAVGNFLKRANLRKKSWITSKSDATDPAGFEATVNQTLKKMQTNYIDMYFLHGIDNPAVLSPAMKAMQAKLKKQGKIHFFGFSCHGGNVVDCLNKAVQVGYVDAIMFRYNFRQYGNSALNKAMDACHKANIGLIAMKTQGSASSFKGKWSPLVRSGKWTPHQAVLKAVWNDKRITAAVSKMDTLTKVRQNIAAALNRKKLSQREMDALIRYAKATQHLACDGCDHICHPAAGTALDIGSTMRFLMYHDVYGDHDEARALYRALPAAARDVSGADLAAAHKACPNNMDIAWHLARARTVLG
ncbi:MAG: aldo/keto reductase [Myxococcales bacterium]|nr:aldo/keto reductase [Myxococcales bacterium]